MPSGALAISHVVLGASLQLAIFCTIKVAGNLRFKDPSLTSPQIVIGDVASSPTCLVFSGEFRGSLIMIFRSSCWFGVFPVIPAAPFFAMPGTGVGRWYRAWF